jgi:undecaprenyl-diphosphatase
MAIPLGESAVLGLVLGLTEFLPVSSSGHLALAQLLSGHEPQPAFTAALHVGTLAATTFALRKRTWTAITEGLRGIGRPALLSETPGGRDAGFVALATLPAVVVGLSLRRETASELGSLTLVGGGLLLSALTVLLVSLAPQGNRSSLSWTGALLVGVAQGTAALPGVSRSAVTLASLLWLGVEAERAFELSMLASLPVVAGVIAIDARPLARSGELGLGALILGAAIAFAAGLGGFALLRRIVVAAKLPWFSLYLIPVAVATLAWGYARP